jgi:chorismate synthase
VDGCPPRLPLSEADVQPDLDRRRPGQADLAGSTQRKESDTVEILSGVVNGRTTGAPIAMVIRNEDHRPGAYSELANVFRPNHADWTYLAKYGIPPVSGGGRASARETAARVAAGAVARALLHTVAEIDVVGWVESIFDVVADVDPMKVKRSEVEASPTRCPSPEHSRQMVAAIEAARREKDSVGGVVGCVARNVPAGWGQPVFDKLDSEIAKALMSIPAAKGVEIGDGFASARVRGQSNADAFIPGTGGRPRTETNHSGGIQGGISNGEEIIAKVAFKPMATIFKPQRTVTLDGDETTIKARGRHDVCVVPRAVPIVEAGVLLVLADHWLRQRAVDVLPR